MPDYDFVTKEDVQAVCQSLCIRDWTELESIDIEDAEADTIRQIVGSEALDIPLADFRHGLGVELEHGTQFPDANVTNNHPILTGRIVLAHLKEGLDYYLRLECMELELDLTKALAASDAAKAVKIRRNLAGQRSKLEASITLQLK